MNELFEIIDEILDTNFLDRVWNRLRFQVFIGIGVTVGTSFLLMIFLAFYIYGKSKTFVKVKTFVKSKIINHIFF